MENILQQIVVYVLPFLIGMGVTYLLYKINSVEGGKAKVEQAIEFVDKILPILIALYKSNPEMQNKANEIAVLFKNNILKFIKLSDEEIKELWLMSIIKIEQAFKDNGYDIELDVNFEFAEEKSVTAKSKLLFK